jgi:hypothetical protein
MDGIEFFFLSSQGIIKLKRHTNPYQNLKFKMKNGYSPKELLIDKFMFDKLWFLLPLPLSVCIFDPPTLHTCGEGEGGVRLSLKI